VRAFTGPCRKLGFLGLYSAVARPFVLIRRITEKGGTLTVRSPGRGRKERRLTLIWSPVPQDRPARLTISDTLQLRLHLPMDAAARRAHRLGRGTCALYLIMTPQTSGSGSAADVAKVLLPEGEHIMVVLGPSFGQGSPKVPGQQVGQVEGHTLWFLGSRDDLPRMFDLHVEWVTFAALPAASRTQTIELLSKQRTPWKLTAPSPTGALLAALPAGGPVLTFSPSEAGIDVLGGEHQIIDAFIRLNRALNLDN
jgi:hypothetical protein